MLHLPLNDWYELPGNCWIICGNKGGKCQACGGEGYCCSKEKQKLVLNADCPRDAVDAIFKNTRGHVCVVTRANLEKLETGDELETSVNIVPTKFNEDHEWDVTIQEAPPCPKTAKVIRLVKTSPFNFDLRNESK